MLVINLYYLNFLGRLIFRPRELTFGGGLGEGSLPPEPPSAACATRPRFAFSPGLCGNFESRSIYTAVSQLL